MKSNTPALTRRRLLTGAAALTVLPACAAQVPTTVATSSEQEIGGVPLSQIVDGYGLIEDAGYRLPPVPPKYLQGLNRRAYVPYRGYESAGTIEADLHAKLLYWIEPGGMAWRFPIGVGRQGLSMSYDTVIKRKQEWPSWTPTQNMLRREPEIYGEYAGGVPGGLANPLGARALYLYQGNRDTYYRIHGTNDLASIGNSGSAGCIRMFNHDVIFLYPKVPLGTKVVIRNRADSIAIEGEAVANRGSELPPTYVPPEEIYTAAAQSGPPQLGAASNVESFGY
ncbi:lipoprotein-anchoring transpeptidase ErfK/SrfK [Limimaricola variabilis]|uniref:Lipoprotein-anchoring transpeptidase ErfK/SrfK n=1 Tax=Limimaricola variabilis TaxID=1492771 RepID=A0ABR6HQM3_9RHOB|nr:L,D-transpeptidase [Limimaricola variabilis]MBB3712708.1 lipoprotein-anchoring transpeptidase ErfK/SrfK [Limimaricola variabilis]